MERCISQISREGAARSRHRPTLHGDSDANGLRPAGTVSGGQADPCLFQPGPDNDSRMNRGRTDQQHPEVADSLAAPPRFDIKLRHRAFSETLVQRHEPINMLQSLIATLFLLSSSWQRSNFPTGAAQTKGAIGLCCRAATPSLNFARPNGTRGAILRLGRHRNGQLKLLM